MLWHKASVFLALEFEAMVTSAFWLNAILEADTAGLSSVYALQFLEFRQQVRLSGKEFRRH